MDIDGPLNQCGWCWSCLWHPVARWSLSKWVSAKWSGRNTTTNSILSILSILYCSLLHDTLRIVCFIIFQLSWCLIASIAWCSLLLSIAHGVHVSVSARLRSTRTCECLTLTMQNAVRRISQRFQVLLGRIWQKFVDSFEI